MRDIKYFPQSSPCIKFQRCTPMESISIHNPYSVLVIRMACLQPGQYFQKRVQSGRPVYKQVVLLINGMSGL